MAAGGVGKIRKETEKRTQTQKKKEQTDEQRNGKRKIDKA
jgi:hypothetical protein